MLYLQRGGRKRCVTIGIGHRDTRKLRWLSRIAVFIARFHLLWCARRTPGLKWSEVSLGKEEVLEETASVEAQLKSG